MTLSYLYNPAALDIIGDAAAQTVSDGRFLPFSPLFTGTAASHPSSVQSSIQTRPRASFLRLCFISSAWLKSSNNQSVFLESALPAIPSIRLYIELWFSLWMGLKKAWADAEKLISWERRSLLIKRHGCEELSGQPGLDSV